MTHWRSLGPEKEFLGAWDFPTERTGTIESVGGAVLPGTGAIKSSKRPIITIRGCPKRLIVNASIGKAIQGMYGANIEDWVGKRITIYASTCTAGPSREKVDCVRVRPTPPIGRDKPIEPQPVDEQMRDKQIRAIGTGDTREPGED